MAISKDLQTTQVIIGLFEKSKERCEDSIENLPGIFCVVNRRGTILKGNLALASVMDVLIEDLLGKDLTENFVEADREGFLAAITAAAPITSETSQAEFQFSILRQGDSRTYIWNLSSDASYPELVTVLGRDITDINRATAKNARMQIELDTARLVQETLFPAEYTEIESSILTGFSRSATECGGDWWHYAYSENQLLIWVGDVTGHGVPAALVMSAVNSAAHIIAKNNFTPSESLRVLDQAVRFSARGQKLMTCFVASIDLRTGECVYSSAAHEAPMLVRAEHEALTFRDLEYLYGKPTFPLGTENLDVEYDEYRTIIKPGDRLCIFTDGIYDLNARGTSSGFFREFASMVSKEKTAVGTVEKLKLQVQEFQARQEMPDDVTMVVFQYSPRES